MHGILTIVFGSTIRSLSQCDFDRIASAQRNLGTRNVVLFNSVGLNADLVCPIAIVCCAGGRQYSGSQCTLGRVYSPLSLVCGLSKAFQCKIQLCSGPPCFFAPQSWALWFAKANGCYACRCRIKYAARTYFASPPVQLIKLQLLFSIPITFIFHEFGERERETGGNIDSVG